MVTDQRRFAAAQLGCLASGLSDALPRNSALGRRARHEGEGNFEKYYSDTEGSRNSGTNFKQMQVVQQQYNNVD